MILLNGLNDSKAKSFFFFFGNLTKLAQRFQVAILKILVTESQKHVFIVEI